MFSKGNFENNSTISLFDCIFLHTILFPDEENLLTKRAIAATASRFPVAAAVDKLAASLNALAGLSATLMAEFLAAFVVFY